MEELKRTQEFQVDEFSKGKLIENQNKINELLAKEQELQNEINCVNDSIEFKDAESVRSGQISHVPSKPAFFPLLTAEPRQKSAASKFGIRMVFLEAFFAKSLRTLRHLVVECGIHGMSQLREKFRCKQAQGNPEAESGDRDKDTIPTPRFLQNPSARNPFNLWRDNF